MKVLGKGPIVGSSQVGFPRHFLNRPHTAPKRWLLTKVQKTKPKWWTFQQDSNYPLEVNRGAGELPSQGSVQPSPASPGWFIQGLLVTESVGGDVRGGDRASVERSLGDACSEWERASQGRMLARTTENTDGVNKPASPCLSARSFTWMPTDNASKNRP